MDQSGVSIFSTESLLSHSTEELRRGTTYCVTNLGVEDFYASEGYVTIFCRFFCLAVPKNLVGESFCAVFQKIVDNEKYIDQSEVSRFFKEFLLSHSTENLRRESFCAVFQNIVGNRSLWIRVEYQELPQKVCCLTELKNFVEEPVSFSLIWGVEDFFAQEGYVTIFCRILL